MCHHLSPCFPLVSPSHPRSTSRLASPFSLSPLGMNCSLLCCLLAPDLRHVFLHAGCSHVCVYDDPGSYLRIRPKHTGQGHPAAIRTPVISVCGGTEPGRVLPLVLPVLASPPVRRGSRGGRTPRPVPALTSRVSRSRLFAQTLPSSRSSSLPCILRNPTETRDLMQQRGVETAICQTHTRRHLDVSGKWNLSIGLQLPGSVRNSSCSHMVQKCF